MSAEINAGVPRRGLAIAFGLCAIAMLVLLGNHPSGGRVFADVLKSEAENQFVDGVVHGGMVVVLSALIVCFALFTRLLGQARITVTAAFVAFCVGSGALMASMILDGFATPAIAARFVGSELPADLAMAKTSLVLLGTVIRFLMPMGLLFQAVAMLGFSSTIATGAGPRRAVGLFGVVAAIAMILATLAGPAHIAAHVMLGSIVLLAVWYLALMLLLFSGRSWT